MNKFSLQKYYLDAVTEEGEHFIGYFAELQFGELSICYADTVHSPGLFGLKRGPKFDCAPCPVSDVKSLAWHHPGLGIDGKWTPLSRPLREQLLSTPEGYVDWNCLQPSSQVEIKTASGLEVEALGCCELLTLTIPPWRLGLKELIWGRFVSENHSVVWLEWKGKHERRFLFWNGTPAPVIKMTESKVESDDFSLSISPAMTLRRGYLGPDILSKVPLVDKFAPSAMLGVHEDKQLGRGALRMRDGSHDEGWVIRENVVWPE